MKEQDTAARFEQLLLPHLDAAYNLARWLMRDEGDAEDVVQEAYLRAFKFFGSFHGGDSRAWLLKIVRNTCFSLHQRRAPDRTTSLDEQLQDVADDAPDPEAVLLREIDHQLLRQALVELPVEFREVLVLRELEGLSYKEIASVADIPMGTVMSRLARGRKWLQAYLAAALREETNFGL